MLLGGTPVLILMLIGAFFVLFYTYPLKYIGLGELTVLLVWGPLMIAGTYLVLSGVWDWMVVVASLPFGLSVSAALFGKHIDKFAADKAKKIRTFPVLVGERAARYITLIMLTLQYLIVVYLVAVRYFTPVMLLVALALPSLDPVLPHVPLPAAGEQARLLSGRHLAAVVCGHDFRPQPALWHVPTPCLTA